jgi:hypothetical protein
LLVIESKMLPKKELNMPQEFTDAIRRQDLSMRRMFARTVGGTAFQKHVQANPTVFGETLALAKDRNWIHSTRLAAALGMSPSNVAKWFQEGQTPNAPTMGVALSRLADLIQKDADYLTEGRPAIAHTVDHTVMRPTAKSGKAASGERGTKRSTQSRRRELEAAG